MNANWLVVGTETTGVEKAQEAMQQVVDNPGILKTYIKDMAPQAFSFLIKVLVCLIIFFICTNIIKFICNIIKKSMEKSGAEAGVISFVHSLVKYSLDFLLIMLILSSFGLSGTIVAVLGSAGLTLGLALQGSLSNFAGGVLIVLIKPFLVGDYIIDHATGKEGTVKEITIFYTKLLTIDNRMIYIPNGTLSNATITNVSKMENRRLDLSISVAYDSDLAKVKRLLKKLAEKEDRVLKNQPIDVFVDELADSEIKMGLRVWVKNQDYFNVKWDMLEHIKNTFDEEDVHIPFPQLDVNMINK